MEFAETRKGNLSIVREGYCYRKRRQNKDKTIMWQCMNEKKGCKGKMVCLGDDVISATEHACVPDEAAANVRVAVSRVRKRAREDPTTPIPQIFKEELAPLHNRGMEQVAEIPRFQNVKGALYSQRRKGQGNRREPKGLVAVMLKEEVPKVPKEFETQMNLQSESSDSLNSRITSNEIEHVDDVLSVQMDPEDQSEFETQQTVLSETPDTMNSMNTSNEIECVDDVLSVQMFPEDQPVSKSTKRPPQEPATSTSYNPKRRSSTVTAAVPEPKSTVAPPTSPTPMAHLEDECDVMGKQIAVQLRELPVEDRLRANLEIQRILMEFRLKHISKR